MPTELANESRDEQACHQGGHHFQVENGGGVLLPKSGEPEGQEAGVSRQTDEGWGNARVQDGPAIDAVGQPVSADVGVEEGVSLDLGKCVNEPQAQRSAGRECEDRGKDCGPAEGGHPPKSYKGLSDASWG